MAEPYLGEIRLFAFAKAPKGWLPCDGQILSVRDNQALYSLLSNRHGGDGKKTFALPDLRGRTPIGSGRFVDGAGRQTTYALAQTGGSEVANVLGDPVLAHSHAIAVQSGDATAGTPKGNFLANAKETTATKLPTYAAPGTMVALDKASVSSTGEGQAVTIRQPYQVLAYCICVTGEFPPRSD